MSDKSTEPCNERIMIPQLVASGLLLWALNPANPYGYYFLLGFVCCGCFSYLGFRFYQARRFDWVWIFAVMAIVYNPFIRVHLTREIWSVVNIITIVITVRSIFVQKRS